MPETRTNSELLVVLRPDAQVPLHRQIETSIRDAIRAGRLTRGSSPAAVAHAGRRPRGLPRRGGGGLPAADGRGVPGQPCGRVHAGGGGTGAAAGRARARPASPGPPSTSATAGPTCPASRGPRGCGPFARALTDAPNEVFGYLTGRGVPQLRSVPGRLPEPGPRHGGRPGAHGDLHRLRAGRDAAHGGAGRRRARNGWRWRTRLPRTTPCRPRARPGWTWSGSRSTATASGSTCCGTAGPTP